MLEHYSTVSLLASPAAGRGKQHHRENLKKIYFSECYNFPSSPHSCSNLVEIYEHEKKNNSSS